MKRKEDIAIWYAEQILNNWQCPYDEIEWLVQNLKEDAFQSCAETYDEAMNEEMSNKINS